MSNDVVKLTDARAFKPIIGAGEWNPRYVSYAHWYGRPPAAQLSHDRIDFPAEPMEPFKRWIDLRWDEWIGQFATGMKRRDVLRNSINQENFTLWLQKTKG